MPGPLQARQHPLLSIAKPGVDAVRKLWLPFLLIQLIAVVVVALYFTSEPMRGVFERLADLKRAGGLPAAAVVTAFVGGVLPELFKLITGVDPKPAARRSADILFNMAVYAPMGIGADLFYDWLAALFGDDRSLQTLVAKIAIDMLLYSPLIALVWLALCYTWREHHFRPLPTLRSLGPAWYLSRVATLLIPCWAYWVPMTALMYSLPSSLTFTFSAMASAAAATILLAVAGRKVDRLN